jgi:hypothetical protein
MSDPLISLVYLSIPQQPFLFFGMPVDTAIPTMQQMILIFERIPTLVWHLMLSL